MNRMLAVCFLVVAMVAGVGMLAVQQAPVRAAGQNPAMRRGVSVDMAETKNASARPEADRGDAWVIAVLRDGAVYFGTDRVFGEGGSGDSLFSRLVKTPRKRTARLFVKADARAAFSSVQQVLNTAQADLFDDVVLLTSQAEKAPAGAIVAPKGLDVWIREETGSNLLTVQIESREGSASVSINNEEVPLAALQGRLTELFDHRSDRIVVLNASGQVAYAEVVEAIDAARGAGASRVAIRAGQGV